MQSTRRPGLRPGRSVGTQSAVCYQMGNLGSLVPAVAYHGECRMGVWGKGAALPPQEETSLLVDDYFGYLF